MRIILLSGGSGKRLWPLSNDIRSKQFLKLLKDKNGNSESMVQRVYKQIKDAGIDTDIVVATGKNQEDSIRSQLGNAVDVVFEPERRDTFPAIALASIYLYYQKNMKKDEVILVLPVDPYAETEYFSLLKDIEEKVILGEANIGLMGIKPTYPSAKYGYIIPDNKSGLIKEFQEKPTELHAQKLIEEGAMWNGGVFAFKAGYIIDKLKEYISFDSFSKFIEQYSVLPKISFDYEIVEKEKKIVMVEYSDVWKDLGTWNTLTEVMDDYKTGEVSMSESCENTHVINELNIPIVVLGAKDMVIAASPDGILVSDKQESSHLKEYIINKSSLPMYEEKKWGNVKVLDFSSYEDGKSSMVQSLFIEVGQTLNYQRNNNIDEMWTITSGTGKFIIGKCTKNVVAGDVVRIKKEQKYKIQAETNLYLIKLQVWDKDKLIESNIR